MARYALVIGISQYSYLGNLPTPTNDAEQVAKILKEYGDFEVTRYPYHLNSANSNLPEMANKRVRGLNVEKRIQKFLTEEAENSEALIYFIGHGITVVPHMGEPEGYLAASDCELSKDGNRIINQNNGISFNRLNSTIQNTHLSSLVVILDCCHSGNFIERSLVENSFKYFIAQRNYYLITSCRSSEESKIIEGASHGVFTTALIKALSGQNADSERRISGDRVFDGISRELYGKGQEAVRFGWGRSIRLLTYPENEHSLDNIEVILNRENPYIGLKSFELEQAELFHGREEAVRALLDRLKDSRFVAVIGASGCGKSSLVKAGLLPELRKNLIIGSSDWRIESLTPGNRPLYKLQEIIERHFNNEPYLLFIDQFEEIFSSSINETERNSFIQLISNEVISQEKQTRVIITIRGDFLDKCAEYPKAASLINQNKLTSYLVQPLSRPELEEAIAVPAKLHGVTFESGLVSRIIGDVEQQPGALPLLQYALKELWNDSLQYESNENRQLTLDGYQRIGEVKGALEKTANRLYNTLTSEDEQEIVRRLFTMELVSLGEEDSKEVTRRRVTWRKLRAIFNSEAQLDRIISCLTEARLIVTNDETVEVAHEALFTEWSLLQEWIEKSRDDIRVSQRLERYFREWREVYNKSDGALLTGVKLATIEEWKGRNSQMLSPEEEEFIQKSLEKKEQELQVRIAEIELQLDQERKFKQGEILKNRALRQRNRFIFIASCITIMLLLFLGLSQYDQIKIARIGQIKSLIDISKIHYKNYQQIESIIDNIQALNILKESNITNKNDFLKEIQPLVNEVRERNRLEGHKDEIWDFSIHPSGRKIVTSSWDKTIRLWSIEGDVLDTKEQKEQIWSIEFNHTGERIASVSKDNSITLWKLKDNRLVQINDNIIKGVQIEKGIYDLVFSYDDTMVAFSSSDGNVRLLNLKNNRIRKVSCENKTEVYNIDFHPKKNIIAYGCREGIRLWEIDKSDIAQLIPNSKHEEPIMTVKFNSKDANILASASDGNIKIWKNISNNYKQIGEIKPEKKSFIHQISFDYENNFIASSDEDIKAGVRIWNLEKAVMSYPHPLQQPDDYNLRGHTKSINRIEFNPTDPSIIISASSDSTIKIWSLEPFFNNQVNTSIVHLLDQSCSFIKNYLRYNYSNSIANAKGVRKICTVEPQRNSTVILP